MDNDPHDSEVLMPDSKLAPNRSFGVDVDRDGDHDLVVLGTKGLGKVLGSDDIDQDANDSEVVIQAPKLRLQDSYGRDLDGDGDYDVIIGGTKGRAAPIAAPPAAPPAPAGVSGAGQPAAQFCIPPAFGNVPAADSFFRDLELLFVGSKDTQVSGLNPIDPIPLHGDGSGVRPADTTVAAGKSQIIPIDALAPGQTVGTSALESCIGVIVTDVRKIFVTHITPSQDAGKTLANLLSTIGPNAHAVIAGGNGDAASNLTLKKALDFLKAQGITIDGFADYEGIHVVQKENGAFDYVGYKDDHRK